MINNIVIGIPGKKMAVRGRVPRDEAHRRLDLRDAHDVARGRWCSREPRKLDLELAATACLSMGSASAFISKREHWVDYNNSDCERASEE